MARLINADEVIKRLEAWNTDDPMDQALYRFALSRILEARTIDAIPKEWILNHPKFPHKNEDRKKCILDMIEDWNKENEQSNSNN